MGTATLTVVIGLAAFNTGTNLLYLMGSMLLSLFTIGLIGGWLNLRGISVVRSAPGEVHAGQTGELELTVSKPGGWIGSYGLSVPRPLEGMDAWAAAAYVLAAPPRRTARFRLRAEFPRRGRFALERVTVFSWFPFGFFRFSRRFAAPAEVIVYPRLIPVSDFLGRRLGRAGVREASVKGHGVSLFTIRDFVPGDPARAIHWKLSAKGGGIKVREYEREESGKILLRLDFLASAPNSSHLHDRFEQAVSVTASLAAELIPLNFEVGLDLPHLAIEFGAGPRHLQAIMKALALIQIEAPEPGPSRLPVREADALELRVAYREGPGAAPPLPDTERRLTVDPDDVVRKKPVEAPLRPATREGQRR